MKATFISAIVFGLWVGLSQPAVSDEGRAGAQSAAVPDGTGQLIGMLVGAADWTHGLTILNPNGYLFQVDETLGEFPPDPFWIYYSDLNCQGQGHVAIANGRVFYGWQTAGFALYYTPREATPGAPLVSSVMTSSTCENFTTPFELDGATETYLNDAEVTGVASGVFPLPIMVGIP
jgi:hypothetical protein